MIILIDLTLKEPQRVENEVHADITQQFSPYVLRYVLSSLSCTLSLGVLYGTTV